MSSQCQKIEVKKLPFYASDITNFTSAVCAVVISMSSSDEPIFQTWANTYSGDLYNTFTTVNTYSSIWQQTDDYNVNTFVYSNSANILQSNSVVNNTSGNWNSVYSSYNSSSASFLTEVTADIRYVNISGDIMTGGLSSPSLSTNSLYVAGSTINFFDQTGNIIETLKSNDIRDFKSNYTLTNSHSANWDSVYSSFASQSANNSSVYNNVQSNSATTWNYQGTDIKELTGNWESTFNTVSSLSEDWNNVYSSVNSKSANWDNVYSTVQSNSATTWNYQGTDIKSLTSNWESTYINFNTQSANNIAVYNSVQTYSGNWNYQGTDIKALTSNWQNTYNNFSAQSANNLSVYNIFNSNSSNYDSVYSTVNTNSAINWNYQGTDVKVLTGNWEDTYNTVQDYSALWIIDNTIDTGVRSLTSNWQNTYINFSTQSANNIDVYNTVNSYSASWVNDAPQTLTFNNINAELTISGGNTVSLSSLNVSYLSALNDVSIPSPVNGQVLTYNSITGKWNAGTPLSASGATGYYGSFYDTTAQTLTSTTQDKRIDIAQTYEHNGVSIDNNRIVFNYNGVYEIIYSIQYKNTSNAQQDIYIWFKQNGNDIPNSSSVFTIPEHKNTSIPAHLIAVSPFMSTLTAGDFIELYWHCNSTAVTIETFTTHANFTIPDTPGVIVTVKQVTNVQIVPTVGAYLPLSGGTLTGAVSTTNVLYTTGGNSDQWNGTYNTVNSNSATNWNYQGTDIKSLTGNWENTYTTVSSISANWGASGSDNELQFRTNAGAFGAVTNSSVSGGAITLGNAEALSATSVGYLTLRNTTPAVAGTQQVSPSLVFEGQGWATSPTLSSQTVQFRQNILPVQAATNATGNWQLQSNIKNAGWVNRLVITSSGLIGDGTYGHFPSSGGLFTIDAPGGNFTVRNRDSAFAEAVRINSTLFRLGGANQYHIIPILNGGEQRNGTSAQTFRLYNTYTSATTGEWATIDWQTVANTLRIGTEKGSGGGVARPLSIITDGLGRINVGATGTVAIASLSSNGIVAATNSDGTLTTINPGVSGNVLTSNGTTWTSTAPTTNPAGSGSELQFRSSASAFGAVTGSSVSGGAITLASPLTVEQGTITNPAAAISVTATWNDAADTFIGNDTNITNTNSAAASRLQRWRVGGTELAAVTRLGGFLSTSNGSTTPAYGSASNTDFGIYFESSRLMVREGVTPIAGFGDSAASTIGLIMGSTRPIGWSATTPDGTYAAQLGYAAAATVQMGANTAVNSATAVAQTLKGPNATGTTSTGGSLTIAGGTGTTAGGAVILATSASTGAPVAAVTVNNNAVTTFAKPPVVPVYTVATLPATVAAGMVQGAHAVVTDATAPTYLGALTGGGAVVCPVFYNGTAWVSH